MNCASYVLRGEAHFWWNGAQIMLRSGAEGEEPICWHEMKRTFFHKYYPPVSQYRKRPPSLT